MKEPTVFALFLAAFFWAGWLFRHNRKPMQPHIKVTEHSSADGKLTTMHYEGPPEGLAAARRVRDAMKESP